MKPYSKRCLPARVVKLCKEVMQVKFHGETQ